MTPQRKQRLTIILFAVVGLSIFVGLLLSALQENINLFYTPTQIVDGEAPVGVRIRAGGLVVPGTVKRGAEGQDLRVEFQVTDKAKQVNIVYRGILPDLFDEGQGIVAMGKLDEQGVFHADEVLAKHDENYMPPEVQHAIDEAGHPSSSAAN